MAEEEQDKALSPPLPSQPVPVDTAAGDAPPPPPSSPPPPLRFDPSRMIGIIRRKAMIKDLAAVYHAECLAYCRELLELQRKWEESNVEIKASEDLRKEIVRQPKRLKKSR